MQNVKFITSLYRRARARGYALSKITHPKYNLTSIVTKFCAVLLIGSCISACEAPLNLENVELETKKNILRFDMFQSVAHNNSRVVMVSSNGAALVSDDDAINWTRYELAGRPSLISVTSCANGDFFALDSLRQVWTLLAGKSTWSSSTIDTPENTLSINCSPSGTLWVTASFSTLYSSHNGGETWKSYSLDEDLQFTEIRFVDDLNGFAFGEFGTVLITHDGGISWNRGADIPKEFYPMSTSFLDSKTGWVAGLGGVIWFTKDGAQTWERQQSINSSPIYTIIATKSGVFAVGDSGTLVQYDNNGNWKAIEAPTMYGYLRALDVLDNDTLVVAGGAGTFSLISLVAP